MKDLKHLKRFNESEENLNISDVSDSQNNLLKDEILSTDWKEPDNYKIQGSPYGKMDVYYWKHNDDGIHMLISTSGNGFTIIYSDYKERNKLFQGFIESVQDLEQVIRLCRLHEI